MRYTGARIILECLKEQGVDTIFGYPGGAVLNIYDELHSFKGINHIRTAHEQAAAHAADGYARVTGKVGVCIATSGPGATNLITGITNAYMDSVPMVFITGQVPTTLIGKDSFQEVDILGITIPITKHNFMVKKIEDLASIIRKAFYIAKKGRPGPVLIDIPKDITSEVGDFCNEKPKEPVKNSINEEEINSALELISKSKKPVIVIGGGCNISNSQKELVEFQNKLKCPVCSTMMGLGSFDGNHPMFTGMLGMHGTLASNKCIRESDLIIAVGARFSDRVISNADTFAKNTNVIHIDIDEAEVCKNIKATSWIIGNVSDVLKKLDSELKERKENEWTEFISNLIKKERRKTLKVNPKNSVNPVYLIKKLYEFTKGEAIITTEVGQNQIWATQGYTFKNPKTFISSGGLGAMGYGFGASIGASIAKNKPIFNISGDGSFKMNCNELATVVEYNIPIKIIVLNNGVLGMVRQWQKLFYQKRFSQTTFKRKIDFAKIGEAYGVLGIRINTNEEIEEALKKAIQHNGPVVVDCFVDKDTMALPIVPPGANIEDIMILD
ncbi:biosynthetic-type acetolactate synthase large subunit [Clostridium brassicae]|uniref:Acetolactate synthase n=1 Tax=Clostridium brassicae TaxID=2999072 RepID=A0ABT4D553_9CLOT|nr:biosynthetic-type acetolactate synthase large subunit [Clostridium brassicae]MCY6957323.1 biosynthetic-type acetolactate synthase large subunit [Clostridium brassicae]